MRDRMFDGFFGKGKKKLHSGMFDDPFFKDSGFGSMDKMFKDAEKMMSEVKSSSFSGGNGHYMKQSYVMSEKRGPDG